MTRSTRPDRLDRLVLTAVGLLLAGAGAYGLARGAGAFGDSAAGDPLLLPSVRRFVADHQLPFWLVAAAVALAAAWLGYRWLRAQFPSSRTVRHLDFAADGQGEQGSTRLDSSAVTAALEDDVAGHGAVQWAKAKLLAGRPRPDVEVRVAVDDHADVPALGRWIEEEALGRLRQALEVDALTARVEVRFTGPPRRSLR